MSDEEILEGEAELVNEAPVDEDAISEEEEAISEEESPPVEAVDDEESVTESAAADDQTAESDEDQEAESDAPTVDELASASEERTVTESANDDQVSESELDNEGDIAADYLEEFLDIVDLDGDIDTYTEGERAHVSIVTDSQVLVGKDGEILDALQELVRLAVLTETGRRSRLILDIGGHREKRRKELLIMAQEAVAEVELTGEAVRLPAMNPYERKIVHDSVAEAGYASESEGVEPQRRVVVSTK